MIRVAAPAKINFFLEITGKRSDGYHTLATLFQTISLADELQIKPSDTLRMTCSNPALATDESNLVLRAAMRLQSLLKEKRGAHLHLIKRIPMGAGLGGGSSDAAAALLGLLKFWKRRVPLSALQREAVRLGADVPFFLQKGLCSATGIGERLKRLPKLPAIWLVLVYPGFGVSTKEAYAKVRLPWGTPVSMTPILRALRGKGQAAWRGKLFNRFEDLVFPDHAALPSLKSRLRDLGATESLMSGSGSSVFGIVPSRSVGARVLSEVQKQYPQSWLVHSL
jgi:4-diphosphocytidyl-2-C-methyl-D-erythritol kinase